MSTTRKDLPPVNSPNFNEKVREAVQTYLGNRGNKLDRGLTVRDLADAGVVSVNPQWLGGAGGLNPISGPGFAVQEGEYQLDLTPPPTPSGFVATAGLTSLLAECDNPTYTQGHGHSKSKLYGATWTTGDPPVFTDAVVITEFSGMVASHATNPATTWHLWLTWVTVDGIESTSPAGGTNGVVTRTGEDVALLLEVLTGEITESQLYADLGSRIDLIDGMAAGSVNARLAEESAARVAALAAEETARIAAIAAASAAQASALADEVTARAAAIALETSNRAAALAAESAARASAINSVDSAIRADLDTADAAVVTSLTSAFQSADAATLTSAQSYTYSKAQTDSAISAAGTLLTSNFQSGDAATLASANSFTYSRSAIDSADAATMSTLRTEFAAADTATLASAQNYTYAKATIDSAIATSATTLRTQLTGNSTATDINTLSSGLLYQERIARASQDAALSQQITLLSAGAGEQFDYSNIWYFDSGVEGWTADTTTSTAVSSVAGWLRMVATTGTLTGRKFQSPAALGVDGAKYPQVRLRLRKVGTPVWVGRLYFTTTADAVWNTTKSLVMTEPTYDANGIGLLTFNMPSDWTSATIAQMRFEASTNITTVNYFEMDWAAVGRPSPGASSAQLAAEELARATADSAEATARLALEAVVNDKASATAVNELSTRVTSVEGVNTSQGSSITSLNNSVATLTTGVAAKADASALTALTTRVTNAEGVNTSQGTSITTLNNNVSTLTANLATKADATALTALTTRVTSAEGVNTTQSGNITTLTNSLTTLTDTVNTKAAASALTDLTTRVTAAEGVNTSQASSITSLNSSLTTTNTNVTAAQTAATNAATLAGSKGKVLVQSTTPVTADRLAQNLWIDTTSNANTPKRWNGSAWVAVTDKVATDAAAAAAAAQATANLKADVTALNALTTTVTGQGSSITAQGTRLTSLESTVNNATTGVAATATEVSTIKTLVNNATTGVVATATKASLLESKLATREDFSERWTGANPLARWYNSNGQGELLVAPITDGSYKGSALEIGNNAGNDQAWLIHLDLIPFDPNRLYRLRIKLRQVSGAGRIYLGYIGVAEDGVTYVNMAGAVSTGTQHYHAANNLAPAVGEWVEHTGFTQGLGSPNGTTLAGSSPASPQKVHANVKYLRVLALVNYNGLPGVTQIGSVIVDDAETISAGDATNAAITSEATTRATEDSALSTRIDTVNATLSNATTGLASKASVGYVDTAKADAISTAASATQLVQAQLNTGGSTQLAIASAASAASAAQTTANTAVTNAATAQTAANAAQTTANTASTNAATANTALTNLASDNILSPVEKPSVIQDYAVITGEQAGIDAQATAYAITTEKTNYDAAVTALTTYLGTLSGWNTVPGADVVIVGATFRSKFSDVYTKRQLLLNAIAAKAKVLADAAQTQANTATTNAATAQAAANAAQTQANTATTNAATAQTTANTAVTNAAAVATRATNLETSVNSGTTGLATKASITQVATAKSEAITASATVTDTISARLNTGDFAAVQVQSSASASSVTGLLAQYTVKLDVGGKVSGYGLASSSTSSEFAIRADRFYIAPPEGSVVTTDIIPFVVQATATTINGESVPAGVYINDAYIKNGTITNAKIGDAAIDNAKISSLSAAKITTGTLGANVIYAGTISAANITSGTLAAGVIYGGSISASKITANSGIIKTSLQSSNYSLNSSGWSLDSSTGAAQFSSCKFTQTIQTANYAGGSTGWSMTNTGSAQFASLTVRQSISSYSWSPNSAGWTIDSTGGCQFLNIAYRGTLGQVSDIRLKKNVIDAIVDASQIVDALRVVDFEWKDQNLPKGLVRGFIAQEVEAAYPEAVFQMGEYLAVSQMNFIPLLVKAVQSLNTQVVSLQQRLAALENQSTSNQGSM